MVCKPGSVTLLPALATIHLERLLPAASSNLPGHDAGSHLNGRAVRMSLYGLAPDGVYHARPVAGPAVRSYRTFSPLPAYPFPASGGLFSVALSLGLPPPGVTRHPDPVEPGLSSPFAKAKAAAIRSSDRGGLYAGYTNTVKQAPRPALRAFRPLQWLRLFQRRSTKRLPFRLCRFAWLPIDRPAC